LQLPNAVVPDESRKAGKDPWLDRFDGVERLTASRLTTGNLTTFSPAIGGIEGESRNINDFWIPACQTVS